MAAFPSVLISSMVWRVFRGAMNANSQVERGFLDRPLKLLSLDRATATSSCSEQQERGRRRGSRAPQLEKPEQQSPRQEHSRQQPRQAGRGRPQGPGAANGSLKRRTPSGVPQRLPGHLSSLKREMLCRLRPRTRKDTYVRGPQGGRSRCRPGTGAVVSAQFRLRQEREVGLYG